MSKKSSFKNSGALFKNRTGGLSGPLNLEGMEFQMVASKQVSKSGLEYIKIFYIGPDEQVEKLRKMIKDEKETGI